MADYTKLQAGTDLSATASWTPTPPATPTTADNLTWLKASSRGGTLTGNVGCNVLTFNGAILVATPTAVNHTGTLTLAGGITCTNTNDVYWGATGSTGSIAVGATTQTWTLYSTSFSPVQIFSTSANALTGTAASKITLVGLDTSVVSRNALYVTTACANFLGTIEVKDYAYLQPAGASAVLTGANFILGTNGNIGAYAGAPRTLGAVGKTLTVEGDGRLGETGLNLSMPVRVVLAGTGTRTLTIAGNTNLSGLIEGTNGITVTAASRSITLTFTVSSNSTGLTGPCTLNGGTLSIPSTNRYLPSALSVAADTRFIYTSGSADYNFPASPTGLGAVQIRGNFAGNGVTFPASGDGSVELFDGIMSAFGVAAGGFQASKIVTHHLPGTVVLIGNASNATPAILASINYVGAGQTRATNVVVDSDNNAQVGTLTAGTYSVSSSGAGPIVLTGTVQRLNTAATASARMNLTLGGTNTGNNTLSGVISEVGTNSAILGITKVDAGRWVLSGTNTHTGLHSISAGTLSAQSATALGSATSTGGVSISGTGVLELGDGVTLDKSVTDFTLGNATNPVQTTGTSTLQSKQVTLSVTPTFTVDTGDKLTLAPQGAGVILGSGTGITKAGDGELELTAKANTFNGAVTVSAGTLTVGSVANAGAAAAWGTGGVSATVAVSGTLKYNGAAGSSSRAVQMTGSAPTIDASGSGALTLSNVTQDTTAKTMTLRGSSTEANTVSNAIANNTGAVSLAKEDAGRWVLSGALTYTGTTAVNGGTLRVETSDSNTTSGAVTIGASGTAELVTNTLASTGATSGEVLGTGNVTCNGIIKTRGGNTQKGQVRYGGNLTFGAGSSLYIGAAA